MGSSSSFVEDVRTLRNLLTEANVVLTDVKLPEGRAERCRELVDTALTIADSLQDKRPVRGQNPAVMLGRAGGKRTAERGPEYFRKIAAMRKTRAGGRPRKERS
jgi:hypothetical protein